MKTWLAVIGSLVPSLVAVVFAYQAFGTIVLYIAGAIVVLVVILGVVTWVRNLRKKAAKAIVRGGVSLLAGRKTEETTMKGKNKWVLPVAVAVVAILFLVLAGPAIGLPEFLGKVKNSVVTGWTKPVQEAALVQEEEKPVPVVLAKKGAATSAAVEVVEEAPKELADFLWSLTEGLKIKEYPEIDKSTYQDKPLIQYVKSMLASYVKKKGDIPSIAVSWWRALASGEIQTAIDEAEKLDNYLPAESMVGPVTLEYQKKSGQTASAPGSSEKSAAVELPAVAVKSAEAKATVISTAISSVPKATVVAKKTSGLQYATAYSKYIVLGVSPNDADELASLGGDFETLLKKGIEIAAQKGWGDRAADVAGQMLADQLKAGLDPQAAFNGLPSFSAQAVPTATVRVLSTSTRVPTFTPRATATLVPVFKPTVTPFNWKCGGLGCRATAIPPTPIFRLTGTPGPTATPWPTIYPGQVITPIITHVDTPTPGGPTPIQL